MSFQIGLSDRSKISARFIRRVHREIQRAFSRRADEGMTQQQLANKLEVNRATVNKRLQGRENITLRTIAEMAWALDSDPVFQLVPRTKRTETNSYKPTTAPATSPLPHTSPASAGAAAWANASSQFIVKQDHAQ